MAVLPPGLTMTILLFAIAAYQDQKLIPFGRLQRELPCFACQITFVVFKVKKLKWALAVQTSNLKPQFLSNDIYGNFDQSEFPGCPAPCTRLNIYSRILRFGQIEKFPPDLSTYLCQIFIPLQLQRSQDYVRPHG